MDFENSLKPFFWCESESGSASICLNAGDYLDWLFKARADEGFEGSGYDWEALARVYLDEKAEELTEDIHFDSEAGMFCAYSSNREALKRFGLGFQEACADSGLIQDLFSRAEPD